MRACNCAQASPFQSRTCEGCDRCHPVCCRLCDEVSIHAPAWGATFAKQAAAPHEGFQSTHPRGVRQERPFSFRRKICFNPRTRVGCDFHTPEYAASLRLFQSTHPRGVRRFSPAFCPAGCAVSIHAPAWGATGSPTGSPTGANGFNPRTRVGCDAFFVRQIARLCCFNPRTRVGCDADTAEALVVERWFQSTHPRGVRLQPGLLRAGVKSVSIHAPAWGATMEKEKRDE